MRRLRSAKAKKRKGKGKQQQNSHHYYDSHHHHQKLQEREVVMHAGLLRYKLGTMRRWIEENNKGVENMGIWWLTQEHWPGKVASSLVIFMKSGIEIGKLRMGRKLFHRTRYDWDRVSVKRTGRE